MKDFLLGVALVITIIGVCLLDSPSIIGYVVTGVGLLLLALGAWVSGEFYEYKD